MAGDSFGVLAHQLATLSASPNKYQAHCEASLKFLRRRLTKGGLRQRLLPPVKKPLGNPSAPRSQNPPPAAGTVLPEGTQTDASQDASLHEEPQRTEVAAEDAAAPATEAVSAVAPAEDAGTAGATTAVAKGHNGHCVREVQSAPLLRSELYRDSGTVTWGGAEAEIFSLLEPASVQPPEWWKAMTMYGSMRLFGGSHAIPHPGKANSDGEDSWFVCPDGAGLGVADGVGEWKWRFDMDPRALADEIMNGACASLQESRRNSNGALKNPQEWAANALDSSFANARSFGSTTALVVAMNQSGTEAGIANLGDSGLRQLRWLPNSVEVVARTEEQQRAFNCPYQLARLPGPEDFPQLLKEGKSALVRAVQRSSSVKLDGPGDAALSSLSLREGDLLLLGTDGVFDNLHDHEICSIVAQATPPTLAALRDGELLVPQNCVATDPSLLARAIALAASHRAHDATAKTPFSYNAKKAGFDHPGGKMDDITVVAAWVVRV